MGTAQNDLPHDHCIFKNYYIKMISCLRMISSLAQRLRDGTRSYENRVGVLFSS